jgi:hypothetical protein
LEARSERAPLIRFDELELGEPPSENEKEPYQADEGYREPSGHSLLSRKFQGLGRDLLHPQALFGDPFDVLQRPGPDDLKLETIPLGEQFCKFEAARDDFALKISDLPALPDVPDG